MSFHSRVGDLGIGVLIPYVTMFMTGASTVKTNGKDTAIVTTVGISTCAMSPTIALTGSETVSLENQPVHRIGDLGIGACGPYIVLTGSSDTDAGG